MSLAFSSTSPDVLLIDDEEIIRHSISQTLELAGFSVTAFARAELAVPWLSAELASVVICDVRLSGISGLQLLAQAMQIDAELPIVLITGHGDVSMAVQAIRDGAYDFIEKPFSAEQLLDVVRRAKEKRRLVLENRQLRSELQRRHGIEADLLGKSPAMAQVRHLIHNIADTNADVLITGETGTGKEQVARCLHEHSPRTRQAFVALNCAALPEQLFESEMFGHEAGAFTGAGKRRIGKLEYAHGGTLFLDEIESMPLSLQAKLLRALQERTLERLGGNESIEFDCRVVAASKEDLRVLGEQGQFRPDLYYRLNVVEINLPPLRERREDIPMLFEHFILQAALRYRRPAPIVSPDVMRQLMLQSWPGNVRELRNVADRYVLGLPGVVETLAEPLSLTQMVESFEKKLINEALQKSQNEVTATSVALGIPRKTLYDKIKKYGLENKGR